MAHQIKCIRIAVNLLKCSVRRFMFYNVLLNNRAVLFSLVVTFTGLIQCKFVTFTGLIK